MAIPGLPGNFIIYQGHLFALKGHFCLQHLWGGVILDRVGGCLPAITSVCAVGTRTAREAV